MIERERLIVSEHTMDSICDGIGDVGWPVGPTKRDKHTQEGFFRIQQPTNADHNYSVLIFDEGVVQRVIHAEPPL